MTFLNSILRGLFDLLLLPFSTLPGWIPLSLLGLPLAVVALLAYKQFSDQAAIERIKARISSGFYEIRLFNDDLPKILKALGGLLRNNAVYIALSLVPLVVMLIPMWFLFAQLQFHYGYHGLDPEQSTTVTMTLKEEAIRSTDAPQVALMAPDGVRVESPAVWIPTKRQLAWRVVGEKPGRYQLQWTLPDSLTEGAGASNIQVDKSLVVTDDFWRISPGRYAKSLSKLLLYPAEPPFDRTAPVESITVNYPVRGVSFLWVEMPWMLIPLLVSIVFAFMIRDRMGVTF